MKSPATAIKTPARRRGAPAGNSNALKHGLYSKHISIREDEGTAGMAEDGNLDELALARDRLDKCLQRQKGVKTDAEWLAYEAAILAYLERIGTMTRTNALLGKDKRASFITVIEMIRMVNREQHVR